ncbi:MAG: NAD(P)/FAD-dependent oxidoreductase [Bacteroidota bacterium]|nr:NAD(P)/FAD-dependent oxidoreductase [Bacteroidota bacterium]MEC8883466.1 NAD(P)/FAD-dependent oxidoreductase [Bacteroidota bacterium]MEE3147297.1 NAD(P)/FAD-dependent oxidoreductase [Bacteroidota bacterium]
MKTQFKTTYEVIIIGGSYSGLSAAMALGRSLRSVLIIDGGNPCNKQTPHSHNFITHDGEKPHAIAQKAKEQVLNYDTVHFLEDFALSGKKAENGFEISTKSGKTFKARKLIFATGIKDVMPDIEGFSACWGITAIHCPYCHGYEFKSEKTAIMANGEHAFHIASLVNNLTDDLTILTQGTPDFDEDQRAKLKKHNINIIETPVTKFEHQDGTLEKVILEDGTSLTLKAVYAGLPFEQHSDIPQQLGCSLTESGHLKVDLFQKTEVPGIYACGDNTSRMRSVAYAVSTGNIVGAMVNNELTQEDF